MNGFLVMMDDGWGLWFQVPPMGLILPYNPNNFVEIKALEYGGFTGYDVMMPFQGE